MIKPMVKVDMELSSFWRWVKDLFQKSDRAQEINFLNAVSTHHGCNELIRAQAIGFGSCLKFNPKRSAQEVHLVKS
ncbi:hypothetical protein lpari_02757 [Legionella parisiensis]|uniref:Uncharacterized protein n=1 Tax=Legionella parisiensis TaxID=45071 RepID=A0A1E5JQU6_9GAMM|nr:hypothetical protein lpari_02757 [Legionella parisiensis]